jgi:hypothetical protein
MFVSRHLAKKSRRAGGFSVLALLATISIYGAADAAEPESRSLADSLTAYRPSTEIDISGPYHAWINDESFPSTLDIWGPKVTLDISMDGQDKLMIGIFVKDQLKVVAKYTAANFNLTTMVEAEYDGRNFNGRYSRIDAALGAKVAPIVLTPVWHGGGGGVPLKMPLPRRLSDIPGSYGLTLKQGGRSIYTQVEFELYDGTVKMTAGGREYLCDYSPTEIFPLYWQGNRMDTFKLTPTENGFKGKLVKEVAGKEEEFEIVVVKGKGGGNGHERIWTYVYDTIFSNRPPVWIAKLTLHDDDARLVIEINNVKAAMEGSLVDGILSGTGKYGKSTVSIRAQESRNGFSGVFRKGTGNTVQQVPVILKNRPARTAGPGW